MTAFGRRIRDWSSDVCASDRQLRQVVFVEEDGAARAAAHITGRQGDLIAADDELRPYRRLRIGHLFSFRRQRAKDGRMPLDGGSGERRVGEECVSTGRTRWSQ